MARGSSAPLGDKYNPDIELTWGEKFVCSFGLWLHCKDETSYLSIELTTDVYNTMSIELDHGSNCIFG